jgi:LysR family transcriptional regulator, glycine cleavage system transcriptional activator
MTEARSKLEPTASKLPPRRAFPPFESLRAFDAVARLGGVRKAAQALLRDHAVISRHLRTLESWTGTTLLERTPGGAVLTAEGREYHKHIEAAFNTIAHATIDLLKRNDDRCVHVWCMPAFALHWMTGHLGSFQNANADLDIELRPTREEPDFDTQEADVVIQLVPTFGAAPETPAAIQSMELARLPTIPVASPDYLATRTPIDSPQDLLNHELLHEEDFDAWQVWFASCGIEGDLELSGPRLWHGHMTLAAARRGRGVALSNALVAGEDIASGRLIEIGAGNCAFPAVTPWAYTFAARTDRWDARPIRRFREWLIAAINDELPARQSRE